MECLICNRQHTDPARTCQRCQNTQRRHLNTILTNTLEAAATITALPAKPLDSSSSGKPGSRPPLNLDALDAANTLIQLIPGDPSSAITIIEMLEMWAVEIRHERHLTPYGPATAASDQPILTQLHTFHLAQLPHINSTGSHLNITEYANHLASAAKQLARWSPTQNDPSWRIPCPTLTDTQECGAPLQITHHDLSNNTPTQCRNGHHWTARRLIYTANTDTTWLDPATISHHLGIHERTLRKWAQAGHVRKRGNQYSWADARNHATTLTA